MSDKGLLLSSNDKGRSVLEYRNLMSIFLLHVGPLPRIDSNHDDSLFFYMRK